MEMKRNVFFFQMQENFAWWKSEQTVYSADFFEGSPLFKSKPVNAIEFHSLVFVASAI